MRKLVNSQGLLCDEEDCGSVSRAASVGWSTSEAGGVTSCVWGGTRLTNVSRDCTRRRVFLLNHDWLHPFGIFLCRLLVHVLSNTSRKVIHLHIKMLLPEDSHDATIGMPKSLVVLVVGFLLQVFDLNLVGIAERFELSLVHNILPLQILIDLSHLFFEISSFLLGSIGSGRRRLNVILHLPVVTANLGLIISGHAAEVESTILHSPHQLT
ncbi:hypothetical protein CUMW_083480 [Citrus unshiu]|nr:hypothetical protein CUMW_083480 [Citrus unshiu]